MRMQTWQRISFQSPSVCIMSGMSGEEQVAVAEVWQQFVGSAPPIFGAVLPKTAKQTVRAVIKVPLPHDAARAPFCSLGHR